MFPLINWWCSAREGGTFSKVNHSVLWTWDSVTRFLRNVVGVKSLMAAWAFSNHLSWSLIDLCTSSYLSIVLHIQEGLIDNIRVVLASLRAEVQRTPRLIHSNRDQLLVVLAREGRPESTRRERKREREREMRERGRDIEKERELANHLPVIIFKEPEELRLKLSPHWARRAGNIQRTMSTEPSMWMLGPMLACFSFSSPSLICFQMFLVPTHCRTSLPYSVDLPSLVLALLIREASLLCQVLAHVQGMLGKLAYLTLERQRFFEKLKLEGLSQVLCTCEYLHPG